MRDGTKGEGEKPSRYAAKKLAVGLWEPLIGSIISREDEKKRLARATPLRKGKKKESLSAITTAK